MSKYPERDFLGTRTGSSPYIFESYKKVGERASDFGSGLVELGAEKGDRVAIFASNRTEWVVCEQACNCYSLVSVPLYDSLGPDALLHVSKLLRFTFVVASKERLSAVLSLLSDCPSVKKVVVMEDVPPHPHLLSFTHVESLGRQKPRRHVAPSPADVATIICTSGTTGDAKAAVHTHKSMVAVYASVQASWPKLDEYVHISYLPLAHIYERGVISLLTLLGAKVS